MVDWRFVTLVSLKKVVVRAIGSDLRTDYTAVGQATHLAARMERLAAPGTIVLTPATLGMADAFVEVKPLGARAVKGLSDRIELSQLMAAGPVRSRLHAMAARGLTTFVGRANELAQLHDTLELAGSGRGQLLAVVGEPWSSHMIRSNRPKPTAWTAPPSIWPSTVAGLIAVPTSWMAV